MQRIRDEEADDTASGPPWSWRKLTPNAGVSAARLGNSPSAELRRAALPASWARPAGWSSLASENLCHDRKTISRKLHFSRPDSTPITKPSYMSLKKARSMTDALAFRSFCTVQPIDAGRGVGAMGRFLFPPMHVLQLLATQLSSPQLAKAISHSTSINRTYKRKSTVIKKICPRRQR